MRKHWWQNSADPGKPQSCGLFPTPPDCGSNSKPPTDLTVQRHFRSDQCGICHGLIHQCYMPALYICKIIMGTHYRTQMPVLFLSGLFGSVSWKDVASPVRRGWVCSWRMLDRKCQKHIWNSYIQEVYAWQRRPSERSSACPLSNPLLCVRLSLQELKRTTAGCVYETWRGFWGVK